MLLSWLIYGCYSPGVPDLSDRWQQGLGRLGQPNRKCLSCPSLKVTPRSLIISCNQLVLLHPHPSLGISSLVQTLTELYRPKRAEHQHHGEGSEWHLGMFGAVCVWGGVGMH